MNKTVLAIIIAAVAVVGAGGIIAMSAQDKTADMKGQTNDTVSNQSMNNGSNQTMAQTDEVITGTAKVDMFNFEFTPKKVTIKKGTTVTWTQKDDTRHDVKTTQDYGDAFKSSELMKKGESYSFTFNTAGTYTYICSPHPYMKGTIEVVE